MGDSKVLSRKISDLPGAKKLFTSKKEKKIVERLDNGTWEDYVGLDDVMKLVQKIIGNNGKN